MAIGTTVKITEAGYIAEVFSMNSQTFDVRIIETRGPFESRAQAEKAETAMLREREATSYCPHWNTAVLACSECDDER